MTDPADNRFYREPSAADVISAVFGGQTGEQKAELFAALAAVQAELPAVEKTRKADVYNKERQYLYSYNYADLADVNGAIMPLLGKNGLAFICIAGTRADGKHGLDFMLAHKSGGSLRGFWEIPAGAPIQTLGGLITYARRYIICALTGVAAEEDVDARGDGQQRQPRPQPKGVDGSANKSAQRTAQRRQQTPAAQPSVRPGPAGPPLPGEDQADYDTPGTASRPQVQKVNILFGELGYEKATREEKLKLLGRIVGRELKSSSELSHNEAHRTIELIERTGKDYAALDAELILLAGETSAMRKHLPDGGGE